MKTTLLCVFLSFVTMLTYAQEEYKDFEVPPYSLDEEDDYAQYEEDIITAAEWIINTPANKGQDKRSEISTFFMDWVTGSPNVTVEINSKIVNFLKNNSYYLLVYMAGWTKYQLESRDFENMVEGTLAGLEAVILFYNNNKKMLPYEKKIEKYDSMKKDGKLRAFIEKKVG